MTKAKYVDGFVLVIPKDKVATYTKMAKEGAKAWKKFGALDYKECVGNDMTPAMADPKGLLFPKMTKAKEDDTIWFSFITYKNRKHRDEVNKKVMEYFGKKYGEEIPEMPFNPKHMAYGGFSVVVG
jgi:uncharacterized protein YbaA (DUF1428 family)